MTTDRKRPSAAVLGFGGLTLVVAFHALTVYGGDGVQPGWWLSTGAFVGYALLGAGLLTREPATAPALEPWDTTAAPSQIETPPPAAAPAQRNDEHAAAVTSDLARQMTQQFLKWSEDAPRDASVWAAFDQFAREMLHGHLGAEHVRCYRVDTAAGELHALTGSLSEGQVQRLPSRSGILGHVATTGRRYLADDPYRGELLKQLAASDAAPWQLVWPVRYDGLVAGLIAVRDWAHGVAPARAAREAACDLLQLFWRQVACEQDLRVARSTDKASGVLTREDFFAVAAPVADASQEDNEPVVAIVIAIEGLRRLDDTGRWQERDLFVERIGQALLQRARRDDVVGRFSDDRFVVLLRRVDSGLGRLIAEKMLAHVQAMVEADDAVRGAVRFRAGVAGSGFERHALDALMALAFRAAEAARRQDVPLCADVPAGTNDEAT